LTKVLAALQRRWEGWMALLVFGGAWLLYALTAAPGTLFGDPSEYQFIPAVWGIAHPPGYAFYTLLAGVWQRLFPVGSVAFRTNLLAGAAGAWTVSRVFLVVLEIGRGCREGNVTQRRPALWAGMIAAAALAVASDVWQHSIHANAHVVSAAITSTQLWLLARWAREGHDRWLYALAFFCGIGVTHHPITVWGLPAYAVFILVIRPRILTQPKTWIPFLVAGLLGLSPWLYFPLRSPDVPFGPTDMRTWEGFLRHATAQGLRVNLFHFGLADQVDRLRVFWTLLRLQYAWPLLILMGVGVAGMIRRQSKLALLWGLFLVGHLAFTLNSVQDVMAYLLHAFYVLALPLGVGVLTVLDALERGMLLKLDGGRSRWARGLMLMLLFTFPLGTLVRTYSRISLHDWRDADVFTENLFARFEERGEGAVLASDWEHLTPYFYHTYVERAVMRAADLRPVYVTGAMTWPESVFGNLPLGPVYLSNYRREIRDLGFRLRPEGGLWRVLEPPALEAVSPQFPLSDVWADGRVAVLGYDLPVTSASQGGVIPLVLYARVATTQTAILMPYAHLGDVEQRWATDSRRLTPSWLPGEIIVERYEVFVPYTLEPGTYPLTLGYADLTKGAPVLSFSGDKATLALGDIHVMPGEAAGRNVKTLERALSNIGNDVALMSARARVAMTMRRGVWDDALSLRAGQALHLTLTWRVLARPRASYTIFIHLIDANGVPCFGHDYTPLGGAFPSYLWFPKWLEGQQVIDPYRLSLPSDIPPGQYWLEVGMYEMGSIRRIPQFDFEGTMVGDRFILGSVMVMP